MGYRSQSLLAFEFDGYQRGRGRGSVKGRKGQVYSDRGVLTLGVGHNAMCG